MKKRKLKLTKFPARVKKTSTDEVAEVAVAEVAEAALFVRWPTRL